MSEHVWIDDYFFSGDFSKWTGVAAETNDASVVKALGTIYAKFTCNSATNYSMYNSYIYKGSLQRRLRPISDLMARGNFRIIKSGMEYQGHFLHFIDIVFLREFVLASAGVFLDNTTMVWALSAHDEDDAERILILSDQNNPSNPSLNTWYTVDLGWKRSGQDERAILTINPPNKPLLQLSVKSSSDREATNVRFGLPKIFRCIQPEVHLDHAMVWEPQLTPI